MDDPFGRVVNLPVLLTMIAAGLVYGRLFLWALNLRPTSLLVTVAVSPGAVYLATVWAVRAIQGTPSALYIGLLVEWFIFAGTAVIAVLIARRRHP